MHKHYGDKQATTVDEEKRSREMINEHGEKKRRRYLIDGVLSALVAIVGVLVILAHILQENIPSNWILVAVAICAARSVIYLVAAFLVDYRLKCGLYDIPEREAKKMGRAMMPAQEPQR